MAHRTGVVVVAVEHPDQVAGVAAVPMGQVHTEDDAPHHRQQKAGNQQRGGQGATIGHGGGL
ncbi:MAG: hypothetical protein HY825_17900 [Acidobacteria bacterium]|nr:hypothetical protein [Acidobacteriota bacterium]